MYHLPIKPKNCERLGREYLYKHEIDAMLAAARRLYPPRFNILGSEYEEMYGHIEKYGFGFRNALLILMMYRHGLRVSEVSTLLWSHVCLKERKVFIERQGKGIPCVHDLTAKEIEMLSTWKWHENHVFSAHGKRESLKPRAIHQIVSSAGDEARIPFPVYPHMLRYSCGHHLAAHLREPVEVQTYLGLKNLQNVKRYFETDLIEFQDMWDV